MLLKANGRLRSRSQGTCIKDQRSEEPLFPPVWALCDPASIINKVFLAGLFLRVLSCSGSAGMKMTRVTTLLTQRLPSSEHPTGFGTEEMLRENRVRVSFARLFFGEMQPQNLMKLWMEPVHPSAGNGTYRGMAGRSQSLS